MTDPGEGRGGLGARSKTLAWGETQHPAEQRPVDIGRRFEDQGIEAIEDLGRLERKVGWFSGDPSLRSG